MLRKLLKRMLFKKNPIIETDLAQEIYNKASDEERKLENEVQEIERKLATDYGKDDCFAQLVDQCFEYKDIEYVCVA